MEDKENIKNRLQEAGYAIIHEYNDPPHENFPDHTHDTDELLIVVKGSMVVKMDGKEHLLKPGDEFYFPAKMIHSAEMGSEGCEYIVGEK